MQQELDPEVWKSHPARHRTLVACTLALFAEMVFAQPGSPSKFANGSIDVLDANSFLTSPSHSFNIGEDMTFMRSADGKAHLHGQPVVLRIFPTVPNRLVPFEIARHEPCFVYVSVLQSIRFDEHGSFFVNHATTEWLTAVKNVGLKPAFYTFVFERGDYPDFGMQFFRLFDADREPYFKRGILVRIDPLTPPHPSDEVNARADTNEDHWRQNKKAADDTNSPELKCHVAHLAAASDGDEEGAVLALADDCEPLIP